MRLHRLLPGLSLVGTLMLAMPAEAARLQFWRFDPAENRLTFTTDDSIQPTAQLLSNPTRLVIDMPGTTLRAPETQSLEGAINSISVSEIDAETTRLVVEYNPGYTVDPGQVQVRGESSRQWAVQLPDPVGTGENSSPIARASTGGRNQVSNRPVEGAQTRVQGIMATADGFFIRTDGNLSEVEVNRSEENGQRLITLELAQTAIALGLTSARLPVNRYSVETWQVNQVSADPARATITLALGEESPDWEISTSPTGIILLPKDISISQVPDEGSPPASRVASTERQSVATRQQAAPELPTLPNGRFTVVLDPGHGGRDPGAVGINGLQEKQVVNDITPQVAEILRAQGVNVVLTRDRDLEIDLAPRVQIAERVNATIFVSIHANAISMSRPDVNGLETFYASDAGQRLANTVHSTVLSEMGMRDRRVRSARFYVIRRTSMPAILIETGFVTGAEDAPNLANPAWRERMATAIARGILLHLQRGV
ncbi:MAG: N-acetylmuramoyl-L-alanine amidase [Cyanobacteria bacterium J06554_11]